jgi:heavy metal efflux system protein
LPNLIFSTDKYQVQPDASKLLGVGLSFTDLAEAIERNNSNRGAGYLERNGEGFVVRSGGRIESIEEIGNVVIAARGGVPVRVKDVADVRIDRELRTGSASENGQEVVIGTALMLIGGNSRTVASAVDAKMKDINQALPTGIEAMPVLNRMVLVDATIQTVAKNLVEGALLVILILFLLLGNFRAALITALVIPIAMLLTMTGMVQGRLKIEQGRHSTDAVAQETSFGDPDRMRRAFLRAFGQPPQVIRRSARA